MKKTVHVLATSLAAAALIGGTAAAADAHEGHGHHHSRFAHTSSHATRGGYGFGQYDVNWAHRYDHGHGQLSFAQKQTLIVDRLDEAAARLQTKVDELKIEQANDPSSRTAAELSGLQAKQTKLQALITAVKAATDDASLKSAFASAAGSTTPTA